MSAKEEAPKHLHVFFFPFLAYGHIIPMADMARLFAGQGIKVSIITTPLNASSFQKTIDRATLAGHPITLLLLPFPSSEAGLPDRCENFDRLTSSDMALRFRTAIDMLQNPFEQLVEQHRPTCIVSDAFLRWTVDVAQKLNIPRLVFNGTSFFSHCLLRSLIRNKPHKPVESDSDPFLVPELPHPIQMTRSQLPDFLTSGDDCGDFSKLVTESEDHSFGFVMNSFFELEPTYVEHMKKKGVKAWHVGPVSLCNRDSSDRGKKASIDEHECLKWLDSMQQDSVVYVCFGSVGRPKASQMVEIASALKGSGYPFIWAVKNCDDEALLGGFEERMEGKGLIVRGWAPQILILNHASVGAFVTHCGWNSVLEGVSAGMPLITWPSTAEQFCNEKLITDVLKIGVGVGSMKWVGWDEEEKKPLIGREKIEMAVRRVMEADGMRMRAKELGEMGKRAVEDGGSSDVDLRRLMEELIKYPICIS